MTLAALVCAYHDSGEPGDGLRATLPLVGRSVVERQARLAAAAGADPVVVLVERLPAELIAAIDRIRSEGVSVIVARSVAEAARSVPAEARLLLIADGLIAGRTQVERLVGADGASLLVMPDGAGDDRFERIDAQARWAGLALIEGEMLQRTATMPQDWDLQSTLLRLAVQGGVRRVAIRDAEREMLLIAEREADLDEAEARIFDGAGGQRADWASRYLLAPVERAATALLMPSALTPGWLHVIAAAFTGLGAVAFRESWLWAGLLLLLVATPLDGIADRLAALRLQPAPRRGRTRHLLPALSAAALVALGLALAPIRGWGCLALVAATLAFLVALHGEAKVRDLPGKVWLAERKGMAWLLLPFAVTGFWTTGLAALAAYAAGSFFWAQRHAHAPPLPQQD